jgi:hypothetical protein
MFDDSDVEERECIHTELKAKQGSSNPCPRTWPRFSAVSPKRSVGIVPAYAPGRYVRMSVSLTAP